MSAEIKPEKKSTNLFFRQNVFFVFFLCLIFLSPAIAHAASIYVDKSYDGEEDGTSEKPYKTIKDAIDKAGSGDKIHIKKGEYSESFSVDKSIELVGEDKNNTIIKGDNNAPSVIRFKNSGSASNLTVSGGYDGITADKKLTVSNCIIKNYDKNGINLVADGSLASIKNSQISGGGKGIYVQKGREIEIISNNIFGNDGEGLDVRDRIKGSIERNSIYGNGEGGIEVIIGGSNLTIKNNSIKSNKSSGIANQFYDFASKTGEVDIIDNTISKNGHFGIYCLAPSGGDYKASTYWNKSLKLEKNKIENNNKKAISGSCHIIKAVSEEEQKDNAVIESEKALAEPESEEEKKLTEERAAFEGTDQGNTEDYSVVLIQIEKAKNREADTQKTIDETLGKIKSSNRWSSFLWGSDLGQIDIARQNIQSLKDQKKSAEELFFQVKEEDKSRLGDVISALDAKIIESETRLSREQQGKSLLGWLVKIFYNKK